MEKKIYVPNEIYRSENISSTELTTWIYLYAINSGMSHTYITSNSLCMYLYGKDGNTKRHKQLIDNAMNNLITNNFIKATIKDKVYIVDNNSFSKKTLFSELYYEDIAKIMKSDQKNKCMLVQYLCILMGSKTHKYNNKAGKLSIQYLADILNVTTNTIVNYNDTLEKLQILYISRMSPWKNDNNFKRSGNVYGNYRDKGVIETLAPSLDYNAHVKSSNSKRSLGNKYSMLCKKPAGFYSDEDAQQIYDYIVWHNKQELETKMNNPQYVADIKDETPFDKYPEIIKKEEINYCLGQK